MDARNAGWIIVLIFTVSSLIVGWMLTSVGILVFSASFFTFFLGQIFNLLVVKSNNERMPVLIHDTNLRRKLENKADLNRHSFPPPEEIRFKILCDRIPIAGYGSLGDVLMLLALPIGVLGVVLYAIADL